MTRVYAEGKGRNVVRPIKALTAYAAGDLLKWDGAGKLIPASSGDNIVAICNETIPSSNTTQLTSSVFVPTERYTTFEMDFTGAGTMTPGLEFDLGSAQTVDSTASTNDDVRLVKVLVNNASDKKAVFEIKFDGQY